MKKIFSLLLSAAALVMPSLTASADKVGDTWTLPGDYTFTLGDSWGESTGEEVKVKIIQKSGNQYTIQDVDQSTFPSSISFTFDESTNKLTFNGGTDYAFTTPPSILYPAVSDWGMWQINNSYDNVIFNPATGSIDFQRGYDPFGFVWTTTDDNSGIISELVIASAQQNEPETVAENFTIDGTYELSISDAWDSETTSVIKVKITGENGNFTITEEGTNKFVTAVPFTFDNNTLTFVKTTGLGADANTTFYPCINEGFGPEQKSPFSAVKFNPATGEIDFQAGYDTYYGSFCFAWAEGDGVFPNFNVAYKINSAVQIEEDENQEPEWDDVGNATFVDGWVLPMLGIDQTDKANQYEVLLQQNRENKNLYRLVNPYATGPAAEYNIHSTKQGYIEFDVTDPEHVLFNKVPAGFAYYDSRDGEKMFNEFYCMNYLGYYHLQYPSMTLEQLTGALYSRMMCYTTFADGVVTLNFLDDDGRKSYDAHYGTDDTSQLSQNCGKYWTYDENLVTYPCDMTARIYFPGFTPEEPGIELLELNGNMTYQVDMNMGMEPENPDLAPAEEIEVVATFNESTNELTIAPFADAQNPIVFTVDLATGEAVAANQVSTVEDYGEGDVFTYYFADVATQEASVTAHVYNADDKTHVYVDAWGEGMDFPEFGYFFTNANFNTVVVLDGNIPGLEANLPQEEPEPGETVELSGNMTYQVDMNMGMEPENPDLAPAEEIEVVATFNEATNELTIAPFADAQNPIVFTVDLATGEAVAANQVSTVEDYGEGDVFTYYFADVATQEAFVTAQVYNADDKTHIYVEAWGEGMDFPDFGYFFTNANFNTVVVLDGNIPGLEANLPQEEPEPGETVELNGNMTYQLDMNMGYYPEEPDLLPAEEIEVVATFNEATNELTIAPFAEYDSITLTLDLATGVAKAKEQLIYSYEDFDYFFGSFHNEEIELTAEVYNAGNKTYINVAPWGEVTDIPGYGMFFNTAYFNTMLILDGNIPGLEASVPEVVLEVRYVNHSLVEQDGGWYITFDVTVGSDALSDDDDITLFVKSPNDDDFVAIETGDGSASEFAKAVAEGKETVISFNVGNLERDKDYVVSMYAKSGLHKSEVFTMEFSSITAGVENPTVDNAAVRYFNLQGVEITEPAAGTTVIKVQGSQATKILVK